MRTINSHTSLLYAYHGSYLKGEGVGNHLFSRVNRKYDLIIKLLGAHTCHSGIKSKTQDDFILCDLKHRKGPKSIQYPRHFLINVLAER